jgi:hypothetical protein
LYPYCYPHAGCNIARTEQLHFHQPGAVPGYGIRQASHVHQKPILRTAGPPFEVVSTESGVSSLDVAAACGRPQHGKKQVPYSLRHTYATMSLAEGVSVFQLAANMSTSVEMLEDFYGKKRMRDPRMATEITKSMNAFFNRLDD